MTSRQTEARKEKIEAIRMSINNLLTILTEGNKADVQRIRAWEIRLLKMAVDCVYITAIGCYHFDRLKNLSNVIKDFEKQIKEYNKLVSPNV